MVAVISCWALVQGLATCLDTLCTQAYGSGQRHLVGINCQRVTIVLFCFATPVAVLWAFSESFIGYLVTEPGTAGLACSYLRVLIAAMPGYIVFEAGKRFLQAQGLFKATTYVLILAMPLHVVILWFMVDRLGFIGGPVAVAITRTLQAMFLVLYVKYFEGYEC